MDKCFCLTFPHERDQKTACLFSQVPDRKIMLLCNRATVQQDVVFLLEHCIYCNQLRMKPEIK